MRYTDSILVLSQDYELFFHRSGTVENCLFAPCDALMQFASIQGLKVTFFVDAGMLLAMERVGSKDRELSGVLSKVQRHIESIAKAGHEIALHIHPHWEDSRSVNGRWEFGGTRYQLQDFADDEVTRIVNDYSACLASLAGKAPTSYRAGGFCIEPFPHLGAVLAENGITIDSSIVPGAILRDADKGFDFGGVPDQGWWSFDSSPLQPVENGRFIEIPITPQKLPLLYYWQRLVRRLTGSTASGSFGDGTSKAIGRAEVLRRLAGLSRVAELSIDDAKASHLMTSRNLKQKRRIWHIMGHPKLASPRALDILARFIHARGIERFQTVSELASLIRSRGFIVE